MRIEKEPSLTMSNQTWRTFLLMDAITSGKGEKKAALCHQECLNILLPTTDMYPEVKLRGTSMGPIVWQGQEYLPGVLPPENAVRQILWELYEVNSSMNCFHWTVGLVLVWTHQTLPSCLKGKLRFHGVFLSAPTHILEFLSRVYPTEESQPDYIYIDKACQILHTSISNGSWDEWKRLPEL